jgi:prepilin-type N-terminal cleavage/methylation domain-containing protein
MKKQKGFTLIELMVVMAIIAILATAGLSAYTNYIKNARDSARLSIASQVETAVNSLMGSNGGVPPTATELLAELERMNMTTAMNILQPQDTTYLSRVSNTLKNIL